MHHEPNTSNYVSKVLSADLTALVTNPVDDHTHEHGEGLEGLEHARDREEDGHDGGVVGVVLGDKTVIQVSIVNTDSLIRSLQATQLAIIFWHKTLTHSRSQDATNRVTWVVFN